MNVLKYKGFKGSVEFSEEDNCYYGKVLNITSLLSYEGDDLESLEQDFKEVVDYWLDSI